MRKMFLEMIKVYWQMITFKRSPLETPDSIVMLVIAITLSLIVSCGQFLVGYRLGKMTMSFGPSLLMICSQLLLLYIYIRFILWSQNLAHLWQKFMTCWVMMLVMLDCLALSLMVFILVLYGFGLLGALQKVVMFISVSVGVILSFWQVTFSVRLYQTMLNKKILFAVGIYLGWFGINFLYLTFMRTLFKI